jgi:hypothetical protein
VVIPAKVGMEGVHNYLKNGVSAREFYFTLFIFIIFLMTGCSSRLGKENVPVLGFSISPPPNSTRVPINAKIILSFNALLDPASINSDLFTLVDPSGKAVPSKIDYSPFPDSGTSLLTLTPVSYFQSPPVYLNVNSVYTVTLGGGIKTLAGDAMTLLNDWAFQTNNSADITPPTFGGAISAEGLDMGSIRLTWGPAVDNPGGTPSNNLIFTICVSLSPTACTNKFVPVYVNPSATMDSNGNYNFILKPLKPESKYTFMVRVTDFAGNQDSNIVQVSASTKGGKLYVANFNNNEILGFDHPSKLSQTASQVRSIKASQNGLGDPYGIFYDQATDQLFIPICKTNSALSLIESQDQSTCQPESNKISVYKNVAYTNPILPGRDQKPDWTLFNDGSAEDSGLNGPVGVYLDSSTDTLYAANYIGNSVTIYNNVTTSCQAYITAKATNGICSVKPSVKLNSLDLTAPFGITLDSKKHLLYVSNYIHTFRHWDSQAQIYNPDITPGTTVAVFNAAALTVSGYYYAVKTISGFNSPAGLWFEPSTDTLYIANSGHNLGPTGSKIYSGIVAICNVSLIGGGAQPLPFNTNCAGTTSATQYLDGPNTGFLWPVQVAATTSPNSTTPSLYVSDYSYNKVSVFTPNPLFTTSTVDMNTFPNQELYGLNGEIQKPSGIAVGDLNGVDNLYVATLESDQIFFFDQVGQNFSQCTPSAPPVQCTFPPARRINPAIFGPAGVFLNNTPDLFGVPRDRLYVSSFSNNSVILFDGASGLSGNAYSQIYKIITSSALQSPFGIYVDTTQSREWLYVVNSTPDSTGMYAVLAFQINLCPTNTVICNMDAIQNGMRIIHSHDFIRPAGIWVDEGIDSNNQPRDILFVSSRGGSTITSPGFISMFNNSSTLAGSVFATKIIRGNQTDLFIPAGLFMDPVKDQLYIANQGYNDVLVFNQPQNCVVSGGTNICNIPPDRFIFNTIDIAHSLDGPSSLVIDFSADQLYLANLGLYNNISSLLSITQASTVNGQASISDYLSEDASNFSTFPLRHPESLALDITR